MVYLHPANGGLRSKIEATIFRLGCAAGRKSDLLLWHQGKSFALELKAPGGRATKSQMQFLADMENAGVCTCLAVGLDAALSKLEQWGLLRGRMT